MLEVALAVSVTALVAALVFVYSEQLRRKTDARAHERAQEAWLVERREYLANERELREQLMYALDKPWRVPVPDDVPAEPDLLPTVHTDFGPEHFDDDWPA